MGRKYLSRAAWLLAAALVAGACTSPADSDAPQATSQTEDSNDFVPKKAHLRQACELPAKWVKLIHRGWDPGGARDLDVILVPDPPNYVGTFRDASHSGPYDFLQEIPLVLYGQGFIQSRGRVTLEREVTLSDIAPTIAALMDFEDWPDRIGRPLSELFKSTARRPTLIVTAVIDGGGWNVLRHWPDRWPNLKRLMERGATIDNAIVGSSPSITPAVHTSLSTGTFPRFHGVTGITVKKKRGSITGAFSEEARITGAHSTVPDTVLKMSTIADAWDVANGNEPQVGMLITGNYPLGMGGVGAAFEGGDRDIVGITAKHEWDTAEEYYSLPDYVNTEVDGPDIDIQNVDLLDGKDDEMWQGHEIKPLDATPALAPWQTRVMKALIEREGFGEDDLTDLFFINYKSPDYAGHIWNMIAPEQGDNIESVDDALGDFTEWLDQNLGKDNYVMIITADHGQTPLEAGGWPISRSELINDIQAEFDHVENDVSLIQSTSATGLFLRAKEMNANGVTPEDISSFLTRYTIADNVQADDVLPEEFAGRGNDRIFRAVFPGRKLPRIVECTGAFDR